MITIEDLSSIERGDLAEMSKSLSNEALHKLVGWLEEKDDTVRYNSLLLLQQRSEYYGDVYPYWDTFCKKLKSKNSYQRSIGLMLISANAKWDKNNRLDDVIDEYLLLLNDEKPITVRQCIQSLCDIVPYKRHLLMKIADKLMSLNIAETRATMQKLILTDILTVLTMIRKQQTSGEIESYIFNALSGSILDRKAVKQVEAML